MRLFLDTSVLLSACGSETGASRYILEEARSHSWELVSADYCREETLRNLYKIGQSAEIYFQAKLDRRINWQLTSLTTDDIVVFDKVKDKPVLMSALSVKPVALLTLDRADFHDRLGSQFYGILIKTPGEWLFEQREQGLI